MASRLPVSKGYFIQSPALLAVRAAGSVASKGQDAAGQAAGQV